MWSRAAVFKKKGSGEETPDPPVRVGAWRRKAERKGDRKKVNVANVNNCKFK